MFKIESYITPMILNELGKYLKGFQPEDFQMSLWDGAVAFQNLDVRVDVLEKQLKLPVEFQSGRVRELTVTVPWSRITSQSINISIDTLELVLKLKSPGTYIKPREKKKEPERKELHVEQPPDGYISSVLNRILANIAIKCQNIIIKLFADNIVLSVNIREISISSSNKDWQNGLTDINPLRKVVQVTDLSICVDRATDKGKIEVTLDPILNKASFEIRIYRRFNKEHGTSSTLVIHIFSKCIDTNLSTLHYSMIMQFLTSVTRLLSDEVKSMLDARIVQEIAESSVNLENINQSYLSWAWNKIPTIIHPTAPEPDPNNDGHYINIASYIEEFKFTLKSSKVFLRMVKNNPIIRVCLRGIYSEVFMKHLKWFNLQAGISSILVEPLGKFSPDPSCYFISIKTDLNELYLNDSLFKNSSEGGKNLGSKFITDADSHLEKFSESYLLNKGAALAVDIVHVPKKDLSEENNSQNNLSEDNSNSPNQLSDRLLVRFMISSAKLSSNAALLTVINTIKEIMSSFKDVSKETADTAKTPSTPNTPDTFKIPQGDIEIIMTKFLLDMVKR